MALNQRAGNSGCRLWLPPLSSAGFQTACTDVPSLSREVISSSVFSYLANQVKYAHSGTGTVDFHYGRDFGRPSSAGSIPIQEGNRIGVDPCR